MEGSGALNADQVKFLLAKSLEQSQRRGRGKGKSGIDTSERTYQVWFKLAHKLFDENTEELTTCSNPNCSDTREHALVALVNSQNMCRKCFLDGYLLEIPGQQQMSDLPS